MCGNGHVGKSFESDGSTIVVTFTTDHSVTKHGFNITTKFLDSSYYHLYFCHNTGGMGSGRSGSKGGTARVEVCPWTAIEGFPI